MRAATTDWQTYGRWHGDGRIGVAEAFIFLVAVELFCLQMGASSTLCSWSCPWLSTSLLLWICTSPAWFVRPSRYAIKRFFVGATVAFASIGAAVFTCIALNTRLL